MSFQNTINRLSGIEEEKMRKLNIEVYDGQMTPHFNIDEFKCDAKGEVLLNGKVIEHIQRLEEFRVWYNRIMIINSGYRTVDYNKTIGGAPNSKHLEGIASDIALPMKEFSAYSKERQEQYLGNVKVKWTQLCNAEGLGGGIGFYDAHFHLDSREDAAFWDLRT